ncbi:hypothetical protein JMJ55_27890 [Belnapia sp. T6]|uniref:DUF5666 domain-containing protein n=1 Tax=Belnapia mucosa TaxID=2804532 RepID=A0ABS1VBW7_9PROT|nr:hypothetical protein [Belnapia mucosa]MBL6459148.1 hypothetical protein [Belnapia mucosa]
MTLRSALLGATAVVTVASTLAAVSLVDAAPAMAQATSAPANPTMTNVIPDAGTFAVAGRIHAIDPVARTLTIAPSSGQPVPLTALAGISLDGISSGDHVSAHYTRAVTFVVGTPDAATPRATQTVGQVARTPGGVGPGASVIVGRVVKVDGPGAFDMVNVDGGGEYTVRSTDPARVAALGAVKAGDSVTASVGALTLSSIARCNLFGLIC